MASFSTRDVDNVRRRSTSPDPEPKGLDGIGASLGRRVWLTALTSVLVGTLTYFVVMAQPKRFTSTASLMVTPGALESALDDSSPVAQVPADEAFYQSQIAIIKSDDSLEEIVDSLNLAADPYWNPSSHDGSAKSGDTTIAAPAAVQRAEISEKLGRVIKVTHKGESYILQVSATTPDADQSEQITTALVKNYRDKMLREQYANATASAPPAAPANLPLLKDRMERTQKALQLAREAAAKAPIAAPVASPPAVAPQPTNAQSQPESARVAAARASLAALESKKSKLQSLVKSGGDTDSIANLLGSEPLRTLAAQQREVRTREATLRQQNDAAGVDKVRLEGVWYQSKIDAEIASAMATIKSDISVAQSKLNALKASEANSVVAAKTPQPTLAAPLPVSPVPSPASQPSADLKALETEAEIARDLYERALQASAKQMVQPSSGTVQITEVAAASLPIKPSWPNSNLALALASLVGVVVGLGTGLVVDRFDDKMRRGADVPRMLRRNAVATLPLLSAADFRQLPPQDRHPAGYVIDKPMSTFAEGLRIVRASLIYTIRDKQARVVTITSARHLDGKTAMSLGLARVAAMSGQKVLLIDCDRRTRAICDLLGIDPGAMKQDGDWRANLVEDTETSLSILPMGDVLLNASGAFPDRATNFLRDVRGVYDLVILDAPPVLADGDARSLAKFSDQTLVIARASQTSSGAVRRAIRQLEEDGSEVPGVVLNFVNRNVRGGLEQGQTVYHNA